MLSTRKIVLLLVCLIFLCTTHCKRAPSSEKATDTTEPVVTKNVSIAKTVPLNLRTASLLDYQNWLDGYLTTPGASITEEVDGTMFGSFDRVFVAKGDLTVEPLYGAESVMIIVPEGVQFLGGDLGHSTIYIVDREHGNHLVGRSYVPHYHSTNPEQSKPGN